MVQDPQILSRDMVVEIHHPRHGKVTQFGQPIKLSETPGGARTAAPYTGEHTGQVLRELGLGESEIQSLRDRKVVA